MQNIFNLIDKRERFNILSVCAHERTQSNLSEVDADFYLYKKSPHIKTWNNKFSPLPKNHYLLPEQYFPKGIQFDFVISHHKFGCFQELAPIASNLKIPLISIEHTLPLKRWNYNDLRTIVSMRGDVNIHIGQHQAKQWMEEKPYIIRHCVDTDIFYPKNERKNAILTVANDYINRDSVLGFSQYLRVTNNLPVIRVGETNGFSKPARDVFELAQIYSTSKIFLNTSTWSPIPTSLLEAMSSGCACVSTNNCDIPYYIDHGVNGLLANSDQEMRSYLELLLKDDELAKFLGDNARNTILEKCSKERYTKDWNLLFKKLKDKQIRYEN